MEKLEWRETFNRQPVHYIYFDFSVRMPVDSINIICHTLQNITALSNSLKGSSRFTTLGVFVLSDRSKCIFPLQSIKYSYMKLQIALDSMQASQVIPTDAEAFEINVLTEILQDSIKQYENYFQNVAYNAEEWPQIQMIFFTIQTSQNFTKLLHQALSSIHLAYINKIQVVILRKYGSSSASSPELKSDAENSPVLFEKDDIDTIISSLMHVIEIDANTYQMENVIKQWLHDHSTDSDHLRLTLGRNTLRCDLRECVLNADALPVNGQYCLIPDGGVSQQAVRPSAVNKQSSNSKVPIYSMDAVALVPKDGLCESLLFGHSYIATATQCWKIDWDDLDRNQKLFLAVARHLQEKDLVLIAKKMTSQLQPFEKVLPTGYFALFPTKDKLLVKSVASRELLLPREEITERQVPYEMAMEAKECLESLEIKTSYNPFTMTSGLYSYLSSTQTKKMRPSTNFVTPIVARESERKRKKGMPTLSDAEMNSTKKADVSFRSDFMTASTLLKCKFPQAFE